MKHHIAQLAGMAATVFILSVATAVALTLSPRVQKPAPQACRTSAPGWVRFETAGKWTSPWIHVQLVTQCYDSGGQPTGPAQYVTWNGQTREWTKDRPADTNYVITPDRKSTRLNSSHMSISYAVF